MWDVWRALSPPITLFLPVQRRRSLRCTGRGDIGEALPPQTPPLRKVSYQDLRGGGVWRGTQKVPGPPNLPGERRPRKSCYYHTAFLCVYGILAPAGIAQILSDALPIHLR